MEKCKMAAQLKIILESRHLDFIHKLFSTKHVIVTLIKCKREIEKLLKTLKVMIKIEIELNRYPPYLAGMTKNVKKLTESKI
jgi:hypothetical protein